MVEEYISRTAANDVLRECVRVYPNSFYNGIEVARSAIIKIPAADVRKVVLCRDCKHCMANIPDIQDGININENWYACQFTEMYDSVKPDDFCSYGEKRDDK